MQKLSGSLFRVQVGDEWHSLLHTSLTISDDAKPSSDLKSKSCFNLAMIDVSGSMSSFWDGIMTNWNTYIAPELKGHSKIYVFGDDVYLRRNGTILEKDDFLCEGTNLTEAIATINSEVHKCKEELVRVFLFTDGEHNSNDICPSVEISKLSIPLGKTIEVFLLGIGDYFPVEFSINIRSNLHNGNSNVPSLFWVKHENFDPEVILTAISFEILNIVDILKSKNVKVNLSLPGYLVPGFPETTCVHTNEFIYFTQSPTQISSLNLSLEDESSIDFELCHKEITLEELLNQVFCQWNSLVIQYHRQKGKKLTNAFEVMDGIYKNFHNRLQADLDMLEKASLKYRLARKKLKFIETEFTTLMNQSKVIIGLEEKYLSDVELAENILKTTVRSKYFYKNLKSKGHSSKDYVADCKQFLEIYESIKDKILALPETSPDDCCRVTMGSTVKDLCDPFFPEFLKEDKFTFLKMFTVTGLPIYAPIKDSSQINPWALCIKNILNSPFNIVSQSTLELSAEFETTSPNSYNKDVFLQKGDESSRFNAIIPVFSQEVIKVLRPLVTTNLFAMLATFCILKDPHIIDPNAHLAALGCAWMKLLMDHPSQENRPQFILEKVSLIQATAEVYLDRGGIAKYFKVLLDQPNQALMTQSKTEYGGKSLKCETLIKPMFLLDLTKENPSTVAKAPAILPILILEFIGRCMDNYSKQGSVNSCPYSSLFVPALFSKEDQEEWFKKKSEETSITVLESFKETLNGGLVQNYFTLEDLRKSLKLFYRQQLMKIKTSIFELGVNQKMLMSLKNESSAGNIKFSSLKIFAKEMSLPQDTINDMFAEKEIFISTFHCLKHKGSKERLSVPLPNYDDALEEVKRMVARENISRFREMAWEKVLANGEKFWLEEFMSIHGTQDVKPMSQVEILETASKMGVAVNKSNFDQTFRYNIKNGLLRNACMIQKCPFYLRPRRTFNQHISISRKRDGFVHQLHRIASELAQKDGTVEDVIQTILGGYQSMNGRKVPPTPSTEHLNGHQSVISGIMKEYKILNRKQC